MRMEEIDCLEEIFVEKYFQMEDDWESISQNHQIAKGLVQEYENKVKQIADALTDGLAIDMSDAILSVQTYIFACKYVQIFNRQMESRMAA